MGVSDIVLRFQSVIEEREIKLVICCEETPVAGTELVSPIPYAYQMFRFVWGLFWNIAFLSQSGL